MIAVVGSKDGQFHFMDSNKFMFQCEIDPDNIYYNEMCGHKFLLNNYEQFKNDPYIGLEHYRRAFDYEDKFISEILRVYDVIVKAEHGPYGDDTNLSVLAHCSRNGENYIEHAKEWVERFPELQHQASLRTHFGCNMLIAMPVKYREMMEEEFYYVDEIMNTPNLKRSEVSYFCETIITPYIIRKHNRNICIGRVKTCL